VQAAPSSSNADKQQTQETNAGTSGADATTQVNHETNKQHDHRSMYHRRKSGKEDASFRLRIPVTR
jgi:hypothetical protein